MREVVERVLASYEAIPNNAGPISDGATTSNAPFVSPYDFFHPE
jgi:hypothetical protein